MQYFDIDELTYSQYAERHGIDNKPDEQVIKNLEALVANILDPLRVALGTPILINSGYRCKELNQAVSGARNSQHLSGQAADIRSNHYSPQEIFDKIRELNLPFDQLIMESGKHSTWIHVSYSQSPRQQAFGLEKSSGRTFKV